MILCIDIGNTNTQYAVGVYNDFKICGRKEAINTKIDSCIISSVVPDQKRVLAKLITNLNLNIAILNINRNGCGIDFTNYTSTLGEDRIVNCVAAKVKHGLPIIVVDFGTATTVNVVDAASVFLGGAIMAGVQTGINALAANTAQLPPITHFADAPLIGANTSDCIISGAAIGTACAVEGYIRRITAVINKKPTVILTGGNAEKVIPYCDFNFIHEPTLIIEGLFYLYENH